MDNLNNYKKRILVSGGAGFIGSNLLLALTGKYPQYLFVNVDCLSYAANLSNLKSIENADNYCFEKIDIRDFDSLQKCFDNYDINAVIHLAAETHVDRSIIAPADFIRTNILGTFNLLELSRGQAQKHDDFRFHHVSTDEVYGSIDEPDSFTEFNKYNPASPYSASKAAADHLVRAWHKTYGLNIVITNSSNNYGPCQFPEKVIPLMINNILQGRELPVYGEGRQMRDWLYVEDHVRALDLVFHNGGNGRTYNISSESAIENIALVQLICSLMDKLAGTKNSAGLIRFVTDRPGHDFRYALDSSRIRRELDWKAEYNLEEGLRKTIQWYLDNRDWLENCLNGEYRKYYQQNYEGR